MSAGRGRFRGDILLATHRMWEHVFDLSYGNETYYSIGAGQEVVHVKKYYACLQSNTLSAKQGLVVLEKCFINFIDVISAFAYGMSYNDVECIG